MPNVKLVPISRINIGNNRRPIKTEKVKELMHSIQTNGLLNPITLDECWNLIAGQHRLKACEQLGLEEVECYVTTYDDVEHARLAEIDENLIRNELEPAERGKLWLERDKILEKLGLIAKVGDNQHTIKGSAIISPPLKTSLELAKEAGFSERTYQYSKQIARDTHPDVLQIIVGTPIASRTTSLVEIARAGRTQRVQAEQAEMALELARNQGNEQEARYQAKLVVELRKQQKEIQFLALKSIEAQRKAKQSRKKNQSISESKEKEKETQRNKEKENTSSDKILKIKSGEHWVLDSHQVYCDNTDSEKFQNLLPQESSLAIATVSPDWNHDYLIDKARVIAVLRQEGYIQQFLQCSKMPFGYELVLGNIYVGIFSHQSISKPPMPINISGVEGIVNYLLHLYTSPQDNVIAPFIGHGEILVTCERMERNCFIGDKNLQLVNRSIRRWEERTGKKAVQK